MFGRRKPVPAPVKQESKASKVVLNPILLEWRGDINMAEIEIHEHANRFVEIHNAFRSLLPTRNRSKLKAMAILKQAGVENPRRQHKEEMNRLKQKAKAARKSKNKPERPLYAPKYLRDTPKIKALFKESHDALGMISDARLKHYKMLMDTADKIILSIPGLPKQIVDSVIYGQKQTEALDVVTLYSPDQIKNMRKLNTMRIKAMAKYADVLNLSDYDIQFFEESLVFYPTGIRRALPAETPAPRLK